MNSKLIILVSSLGLAVVSSAAVAQNTGDCKNMLTAAVGLSLDSEGYDTSNVCHLSVSDLALIKSLLTEEGMGTRSRIQNILDQAS
ncbi:MAG: hypothetical protein HKN18_09710 [Silicimonas sp.]|nr:hypothetical protein [Silicimonas sp.]